MNEQLQKALADILTMLQKSAETVGSAAQTEVPLLVQEYLRWGVWSAALWLVASVVIGGGMLTLGRVILASKAEKWLWKNMMWSDGYIARNVLGVVLTAGGGLWLCLGVAVNLSAIIKITLAPRVYLLETVMQAIK